MVFDLIAEADDVVARGAGEELFGGSLDPRLLTKEIIGTSAHAVPDGSPRFVRDVVTDVGCARRGSETDKDLGCNLRG